MKNRKLLRKIFYLSMLFLFLLSMSGCSAIQNMMATPTSSSTPTPLPTLTPTSTSTSTPTPTFTPTPEPTITLTPRPTSVPGSTFEITTEGITLKLEVPSCGIISVGFGGREYKPLASDSQLCFVSGEIIKGTPLQSDVDNWVNSGKVYLLDQEGCKGLLIYASANTSKQSIFWIFSAPENYAPFQLQMLNQLFDLP